MLDLEIRQIANPVEYRKQDKSGEPFPGTLSGYAAVFNRYSQNLGGFVEQIDPAAFNKSLSDKLPVFARYNHDDAYLLGTSEAGTLRLSVDETGLRYEVDLPDTSAGRDIAVLAKRGDVRFSSFAFRLAPEGDEWDLTEEGFPLRTLRRVQLVDVAPVNSPAYRDTTVGMRSLAEHLKVDLETVRKATVEDLRSLIKTASEPLLPDAEARQEASGTPSGQGQSDTHPNRSGAAQRVLELNNKPPKT